MRFPDGRAETGASRPGTEPEAPRGGAQSRDGRGARGAARTSEDGPA